MLDNASEWPIVKLLSVEKLHHLKVFNHYQYRLRNLFIIFFQKTLMVTLHIFQNQL